MSKIIAVTDANGNLLGVVHGDPVDIGNGQTIQAAPIKHPDYRYHVLDSQGDLMKKPAAQIHDHVRKLLPTG
jgi:uncharacterized protein YcsI (UPF0317 family)